MLYFPPMITSEQQQWLDHLSDTDTIAVVPWDPTAENKFLQIKEAVQAILGKEQVVLHRGATSLKISGQDEIDIYVPVSAGEFDETVRVISNLYKLKSLYALKRARLVTSIDNKHIDVFVVNKDDNNWIDGEIFTNYLLNHANALEEYRKLKENASGKTVREYYTRKIEFINEILAKTQK